jgi:hypothetical protein
MSKSKDQILLENIYQGIFEKAYKTEDEDAREAYPHKDDAEESKCDDDCECDECQKEEEDK